MKAHSDMVDADYIVVGSGAGGGPLAANLARHGFKVLLLEAGGDIARHSDEGRLLYEVPAFHGSCSDSTRVRWDFWVHHYRDEEREKACTNYCDRNKAFWYPRAGTLGGCTAHNAMITVIPQARDWNEIALATGDQSWCAEKMFEYWTRLERCEYKSRPGTIARLLSRLIWSLVALLGGRKDWRNWSDGHGFAGWLPTSRASPDPVLPDAAIIRILLNAFRVVYRLGIGEPFRRLAAALDINDARDCWQGREGLSLTTMTMHRGRRHGPRELILEVERQWPDRLNISLNTLVTRILFDGTRAIGVEALEGEALYRGSPLHSPEQKGVSRQFMASREIIISAGAFNSPQLLKLSGIGPKEELEHWGIKVVVPLRGVGENLQDRYEVSVITERAKPFALVKGIKFSPIELLKKLTSSTDPTFEQWRNGKGLYCSTGSLIAIIKRSTSGEPESPDLCILGFPGKFSGYYPGYSDDFERHQNKFSWVILKAYTCNKSGRVTLEGTDPTQAPRVDFCYFDDVSDKQGRDLRAVFEGVEFVRSMNARLGKHFQTELVPGKDITEAALTDFIKKSAWGHHASCTNKMGPRDDCMAVVDNRFRVHGTQALRVVDASIFPKIPGYFIVAAVYMISEKAFDVIVEDASAGSSLAGECKA